MSVKLKRCPFCGGEARTPMRMEPYVTIWCECTTCNARTAGYCPNTDDEETTFKKIESCENKAIEAWNKRVREDNGTERSEYDRGYDDAKADEYDKVTHLIENIKKEFEVEE